jgi:hypothetical protein
VGIDVKALLSPQTASGESHSQPAPEPKDTAIPQTGTGVG